MTDYKTTDVIPEAAMNYMRNLLRAYRELGIKVFLNIYYQNGHQDSIVTADIVLKHIEQYAILWEEYSDVIFSYCLSLVGAYGEWTSTGNGVDGIPAMTEAEKQAVVDKVLEKLPSEISLTVRDPEIKSQYIPNDHPRYSSIGYDQSAFFGLDFPDADLGQGNFRPGQEAYEIAKTEAPYAIMYSETFTSRWFNEDEEGSLIDEITALPAIKSLSEQRVTAFNINHAYGDIAIFGGNIEDTILYQWRLNKIKKSDLSDIGVLCTDSWFTNNRNKTVVRSAFDYIREYLGYHLSVDDLSVTGGNNLNDSINISINLRNYGFSAAFNLESGFAILDENNNMISEVLAGNPMQWHSTNPEDYSDRTQLIHNVTADMNLPSEAGTYKIAFFLRNKLGENARLDNLVEFSNGYNILHTFSVD